MNVQPDFVRKLTKALKQDLHAMGLEAKVYSEPVPRTKLFRFMVLADGFADMDIMERQGVIWRTVGRTLTYDENLLVSMILTMTPAEERGEIIDDPPVSTFRTKRIRRPQARRAAGTQRQASGHR